MVEKVLLFKGVIKVLDFDQIYKEQLDLFFKEDDLQRNMLYLAKLPTEVVQCQLKLKDDLILAGLPFFVAVFNYLKRDVLNYSEFKEYEGKKFIKDEFKDINFELPFNVVLTGERIALNLLQRASGIATNVARYASKLEDISILDTRKTTPGLRFLEKYAVTLGGGVNHRFGQMDAWMIKDNHKNIFGGVEKAVNYFKSLSTFYQPLILEIHKIEEIEIGLRNGVRHFLLDNFTPSMLSQAIAIKQAGVTYEVSGGVTLENLSEFSIAGIDAISSGAMVYNAPTVDISLKYYPKKFV